MIPPFFIRSRKTLIAELPTILVVCMILVFGSMLQSAAGFAFGMFAIPMLMIFAGYESYEAIAMISLCGGIQTIAGAWTLRTHIIWSKVAGLTAVSLFTVPLGVLTQGWLLDSYGPDRIKQVFGGIILLALIVQILWRVKQRDSLHVAWGLSAGGIGGFIGGISGMGGPPIVMWVHAHNWSNQRCRATLWAFFTGLVPLQIGCIYWKFAAPGQTTELNSAMLTALLFSPIMIVGIVPGLWLGHRISKPRLRLISFSIIFIISFSALLGPYWKPSRTTPAHSDSIPDENIKKEEDRP